MHPTFNDRPARDRFLRREYRGGVPHPDRRADPVRACRGPAFATPPKPIRDWCLPARSSRPRASRPLKDKEGLEIDQSLLLAHILADPRCGTHLCHAMLLPRPEAAAALATLAAQGFVDLGPVRVERHGRAAHLLSTNPRYLNAEDQGTIDAMEIGVDVATLDPGPKSRCCAGSRSSTPSMPAGASSAPAST